MNLSDKEIMDEAERDKVRAHELEMKRLDMKGKGEFSCATLVAWVFAAIIVTGLFVHFATKAGNWSDVTAAAVESAKIARQQERAKCLKEKQANASE